MWSRDEPNDGTATRGCRSFAARFGKLRLAGNELFTVVELDGKPYAAVTITTGAEDQRVEPLAFLDLDEVDRSLHVSQPTGGLESGLITVSAGDGIVVIQTAGEGGISTRALSLDTEEEIPLPNGPAAECWNDFATEAGVRRWFFQIVDGGARYSWVEWNRSAETAARLVVADADTGTVEHSVDLGTLRGTWKERSGTAPRREAVTPHAEVPVPDPRWNARSCA
jgi:hypothetical protein